MAGAFDPNDPNFYNNLTNWGFATMAAGAQPGITTLGAIGQGGVSAGQTARENALVQAQTGLYGAETQGKQLGNAMALRSLNFGNAMYGLAPVTMPGVPDLMNQQPAQPTNTPPVNSTGQPWSATPGASKASLGGTNSPQGSPVQLSSDNAAKMADLYPDSQISPPNSVQTAPQMPPQPQSGGMFGYSKGAIDVARGLRAPQTLDEATQAASLLSITGVNPNRQKELEGLVAENQKPQNLREGNQVYYPLGGGTVAASKNVGGYDENNVPIVDSYTPSLVVNGKGQGGRNIGGGASTNNGKIRTGFSPEEKETQDNFFGPEATTYNGAIGAKYNLALLQNDLDTVNKDPNSFLSTGAGGTSRMEFAKKVNLVSNQLFGKAVYDPEKLSSAESLFKQTGRLGFDMSKQLGAREPGVITQQAIKLNPGMDNTPQGAQLITNTLVEAQQRIQDERAFKSQYYKENGYHQSDAEQAFDNKFTPELYAKRATSQLQPITVNTPAAAKQLLGGTKIKTPDGKIKIVPPNIGLMAPVYHGAYAPEPIPQEQPEQE